MATAKKTPLPIQPEVERNVEKESILSITIAQKY